MIHQFRKYAGVLRTPLHRDARRPMSSERDSEGSSLEDRAARLRRFLQDRGPLFSSLALYLSSRIDAIPAEYCREFALIPDAAPAMPQPEVERIITAGLGADFRRLVGSFDFTPVASRLILQTHAAVLLNGERVSISFVRPDYEAVTSVDQMAALLPRQITDDFNGGLVKNRLIADFLTALRRATDLSIRRRAFASALQDTALPGISSQRRVYTELSGRSVLTLSCEAGMPLEEIARSNECDGQKLARDLCLQWLRESLCGRFCAVDPRAGNTLVTRNLSFSFSGHEFIELPQRVQDDIRGYLLATLVDDPDQATGYLMREMISPRGGLEEAGEFRSNFRQAAPFGALEPVLGTDTNALAQLVFQHWKTALSHRYTPSPDLLAFYRGFFSVTRMARELDPEGDPMRAGLEELDAVMAADQFKEIADTGYWTENADKFAMAMIGFPAKVDDALTRAAGAQFDRWSQPAAGGPARDRGVAWARWLLVAAGIIFILHSDMSAWTGQIAALALMIAGLIALGAWEK